MFQALFNSLSGLFSFSRSLDTVSNNVSNMNTPGFRGSDTFFENVNGGLGTRISGDGLRTSSGDIRQTGTPTDLAIDGNGFFVLRDGNGNLYYTRAGQFRFNEDGLLVDSVTGYQVMAIDSAGNLQSIDLDGYRTLPPQATTSVRMVGNIAPGTPSTTINSIRVYDSAGALHTLTATLTDNTAVTPGSYLVSVVDETGATIGTGEVRFGTDGTPLAGFNTLVLNPTYQGVAQSITLNFGTPGAFSGATRLAGIASNLGAQVADGHPLLGITDLSFDDKGVLQVVYSSSEKRSGPQIALASFPNESALDMVGGRLIAGTSVLQRELGRPGEGVFGRIAGGSLELSNVDLTQEFADMIIIQRGYQASSRVMTVSNEMIEQLYNSTRGG
ncbi:flagellar basal-body rod protein FlgF [Arenimonas sp.]|uniref:flagellar basal-body rod protein FlgF n=1 Tax=Arenimonas sp. TaxID=1872635 RepID=UPI0039E35278